MAEQAIEPSKRQVTRPKLACRLFRRRQGRAAQLPGAGEIELENTSEEVLEIEVQMSPLQHLNLVVRNSDGQLLSEGHYGNCFSPLERPYALRLQPGEKYTGPVSLMGNVPPEKRLPGKYTVQAVYEYHALRSVSEPFEVELPG